MLFFLSSLLFGTMLRGVCDTAIVQLRPARDRLGIAEDRSSGRSLFGRTKDAEDKGPGQPNNRGMNHGGVNNKA